VTLVGLDNERKVASQSEANMRPGRSRGATKGPQARCGPRNQMSQFR